MARTARDIEVPLVDRTPNSLESPEWSAGLWNTITFSWMNGFIAKGNRLEEARQRGGPDADLSQQALMEADLLDLRPDDRPAQIAEKAKEVWGEEASLPVDERSLRRALRKGFGRTFYVAAGFKFIYDSLQMIGPYVLKHFLKYLNVCEGEIQQHQECDPQEGYYWVAIILASALLQTAVLHQYFHRSIRTGMRLNSATISLIYRKSLVIAGPGKTTNSQQGDGQHGQQQGEQQQQQRTSGEIVNLMSVDAQRIRDTMTYLHTLWSGPYQIMITLIFLWAVIRWATLAGLAVMLLQIPLVTMVARRVKLAQRELMKRKDQRVKETNEVFSAIRLLKMYAWEDSFEARLDKIRDLELTYLRQYQRMNILSASMYQVAPILTGVGTLGTYTLLYGQLSAAVAFSALSLFSVLRFPLTVFPNMITSAVEANVALGRIESFFATEEIKGRPAASASAAVGVDAVQLQNAKLEWPGGIPLLTGLNFSVPAPRPGQERAHLTVVIGSVGVGKSGLLQALIGDLSPVQGSLAVNGTIAYAAQVAWILNATVKSNILFNSEVDEERYQAVVKACCLLPDFDALPDGEATEIGERGVNLSGGQKQRVSLARAVYAKADLLLLDDPMSAVDPEVAQKLCKMLRGPLVKSSSIILCTHYEGAIRQADQVILLERNSAPSDDPQAAGTIEAHVAFCGPPNEFSKKHKDVGAATLKTEFTRTVSRDVTDAEAPVPKPVKETSKLVQKEQEMLGSVSWEVYKTYVQYAGGTPVALAVVVGLVFGQATSTMADAWVAYWSDNSDQGSQHYVSSQMGVTGYALTSFLAFFGIIGTSLLFRMTALRAAKTFHKELLSKMLQLPMSFYDTTPLGRVLNRFSKDIYTIDEALVAVLMGYCSTLIRVFATLILILYATPWFWVVIIPLLYIYRATQNYYVPCSRQLKRMESNLQSPIFSHFAETLDGVASIRAFGQQDKFMAESLDRVQRNQRAYYLNVASNRWLAVRLESLGTIVVMSASLLAVFARQSISAGVAGLSITYALSVTQAMNWVVRMTADRETNVVAVERVSEYIRQVPEPPRLAPAHDPASSWPSQGGIVFEKVQLRYRPNLPLVLDDFNLEIRPREKIGICGRTGAGKSSLLNVVLRIVEPCGGRTLIDGVDISQLGLHRLRRSLTVLPQDPVLFSGTLRFNLDPAGESSDEKIWEALTRSHLSQHTRDLAAEFQRRESPTNGNTQEDLSPAKCLSAVVAEKGENYSLGQRQQACLARALLRSNKILLLDEATSAVDAETDSLIQKTIRTEFADHTVLCIAHRISTVMANDRICVVADGKVAELGSPKELLDQPDSRFKRLAEKDMAR